MTLVVAFTNGESSYMLGDSMLTPKGNQLQVGMRFPTEPIGGSGKEVSKPVTGLAQKIVRLRPNMFLGWSGDLAVAIRHLDFLRAELRRPTVLDGDVLEAQAEYFKLHTKDFYELSTILLRQEPDEVFLGTATRHVRRRHPTFGEIFVIGSGTQAFLQYLDAIPLPSRFASNLDAPQDAVKVSYILNYLALTMNHQQATGFGVGEGWGAAFEIVLSKDGHTLEKLDNVLYQTYHWRVREDQIETFRQGRRYLQYYIGDNLVVLAQGKKEALSCWIIPPPDKVFDVPPPIKVRPPSPEMVCTNLLNIDTQKARTPLQWQQGGNPNYGVASFDDQGESIRANSDAVKNLIRQFVADDAS